MSKSSRGSKRPKDQNAPKKAQSSYFIFSNERRSILQAQNRDKKITEISKLISAEWKLMDDPTKKDYERRAAELKKKYVIELEKYKLTDNYKLHQNILERWKENEKNLGRYGGGKKGGKRDKNAPKKPKQPDEMPKRPQSSYFVFSNQRRTQLRLEYPDKKITELSKLIASEWSNKTDDEKKIYQDQALINKQNYHDKMDIYKQTDEYKNYQNELKQFKIDCKNYEQASKMDIDGDKPHVSMPRKPKDKCCPKRPLTSYFVFAQKVRDATKTEFPNLKITEIAKEISKKWQAMNDDDKKPYLEKAAVLKEQYKKNLSAYTDSDEAKQFKIKLDEWKVECEKRRKAAVLKRAKAAAAEKKKKSLKMNKKKVIKNKKKKYYSDDSDSDSDSSSGSYSSSDGSSSSSSSSSDGSDSDSSSSGSSSD